MSKGGCHDFCRDWGIVTVHWTAFWCAIFVTIPPSQLSAVPPPFTQGRQWFPQICADSIVSPTPHLLRYAQHLFLPKTGPFCRLRRHFPRTRGNLLKEKACAATGGNFPVNKLPTYMEAYSTMHKAGSSSRLFPCLSRRGTAVCPFFTLLSLTKRLPEIHRQALCLLTARCTGGRAAA